jgi:hypothetical protein
MFKDADTELPLKAKKWNIFNSVFTITFPDDSVFYIPVENLKCWSHRELKEGENE